MRDDFEVTVRVRNNHLKSRRDELGFTQGQLAEAAGFSKGQYGALESLRDSPLDHKGQWRNIALSLASFFDVMPGDLFPPDVIGIETAVATRTVNASDLLAITNGSRRLALPASDAYDAQELAGCFDDVLSTLSPKQQFVIKGRFYEDKTLEELGQDLFLTRDAVRQIESKALRMLRHPGRAGPLRPFVEGAEERYAERTERSNRYHAERSEGDH